MASLSHTLKIFWTGKRFLKLLIFALIMANVTMYCVGVLARRQVIDNSINYHNKIYMTYLQYVERYRKMSESGEKELPSGVSHYWLALRELRKQFPLSRLNVVLHSTAVSDRDRKVLEVFKNKPRGWSLTDETEGWARTFYVLPTKNISAFQVVSFVREDLNAWENTAMMIGGYAFILLFAFGWFWTRGFDESSNAQEISARLAAASAVVDEIGVVINDLRIALDKAPNADVVKTLDELASQIRMLAVNGSIEAARSVDTFRVFHVMMQEINHLATQSRELLKNIDLSEMRQKIDAINIALKSGPTEQEAVEPDFSASYSSSARRAR